MKNTPENISNRRRSAERLLEQISKVAPKRGGRVKVIVTQLNEVYLPVVSLVRRKFLFGSPIAEIDLKAYGDEKTGYELRATCYEPCLEPALARGFNQICVQEGMRPNLRLS